MGCCATNPLLLAVLGSTSICVPGFWLERPLVLVVLGSGPVLLNGSTRSGLPELGRGFGPVLLFGGALGVKCIGGALPLPI
jgi:hypothetical protein